jgi:hypothetical protein
MTNEKPSLFEKFLYIMSAIGAVFASIFFYMYRDQKQKKEKLEVKEKITVAETTAKTIAKERNEKSKAKGSSSIATDCANLIDE